ncbi:MAG: aspartate-semialdehyde dehydrogenase [Candidatus Omnitrophica bacterium]|nr:aspartate-semialdehyde dehydrogenase [Candidatus Omnitrophota bacterium]
MKKFNVAVVGVGAVGVEMLRILKERKFPVGKLKVFARSERDIYVDKDSYHVLKVDHHGFKNIDIALFAGTEGEKGAAVTYASSAIKQGAVVIDNGADFRMEKDVPLVVPEVNPKDIKKHKGIISNPNCSTIQMVVALAPIQKRLGLKRIIVCSYQAASGAGRSAVKELMAQSKAVLDGKTVKPDALPQQIAFNVFPHIGGFQKESYTSEEWKTVKETHKIFHDDKIKVTATCVRVPVATGHSEAVYIETKKAMSVSKLQNLLSKSAGIEVVDDPKNGKYPLPINAEGKDAVYVGRIRKDPFVKNAYWLWVVSDNLRKGAALNAIQIAELLIK